MNSRGGAPPPNQASYPEKPAFPSTSYAQGKSSDFVSACLSCYMYVGGVSFTFRKRWGQIDWRKLGESLTQAMGPVLLILECLPWHLGTAVHQ